MGVLRKTRLTNLKTRNNVLSVNQFKVTIVGVRLGVPLRWKTWADLEILKPVSLFIKFYNFRVLAFIGTDRQTEIARSNPDQEYIHIYCIVFTFTLQVTGIKMCVLYFSCIYCEKQMLNWETMNLKRNKFWYYIPEHDFAKTKSNIHTYKLHV